MSRFKKSLLFYICFGIAVSIYCYSTYANESIRSAGVGKLFFDFKFMFILLILLFKDFQTIMSDHLLFTKFNNIRQLLLFKLTLIIKKLFIHLCLLLIFFIILECIMNTSNISSTVPFLCYRVCILFIILATFFMTVIAGHSQNINRNITIGILISCTLYILVILYGPQHVFNKLNPFAFLNYMNFAEIPRFLLLLGFIMTYTVYKILSKGKLIINDEK